MAHLRDLLLRFDDPREFLGDWEVSCLGGSLVGQILHQVIFQHVELVGGLYHVDQLRDHEVLALLQGGVVLNFVDVIVFFEALLGEDLIYQFFIHAFLNLASFLWVFLFVLDGLALVDVDGQEGCLAARTELPLVVLWNGE